MKVFNINKDMKSELLNLYKKLSLCSEFKDILENLKNK